MPKKYFDRSPITITTKFKRPKKSIIYFKSNCESISQIDVTQFFVSDISDNSWEPKLVKTIERTNNELTEIKALINTSLSAEKILQSNMLEQTCRPNPWRYANA